MKKSNKILLVLFLVAILVLTGIHIALYAKYKNGSYTAYSDTPNEEHLAVEPLNKYRQIQFVNVGSVLVHLSDKPSLKYDKKLKEVKLLEKDGVLFVSVPKGPDGKSNHEIGMQLYVDSSLLVSLKNSGAYLMYGDDASRKLNIALEETRFATSDDTNKPGWTVGGLNIAAAKNSKVVLNDIQVNKIAVDLKQSVFSEERSSFREMQFRADDSSRVSLSSSNLLKLTKTNINE